MVKETIFFQINDALAPSYRGLSRATYVSYYLHRATARVVRKTRSRHRSLEFLSIRGGIKTNVYTSRESNNYLRA